MQVGYSELETVRIVGSRLVGVAVAEEVRSDDGVMLGELGNDVEPAIRAVSDAVDEQDGRAAASEDERAFVAVNGAVVAPLHSPRVCRAQLGRKPNDVSHDAPSVPLRPGPCSYAARVCFEVASATPLGNTFEITWGAKSC